MSLHPAGKRVSRIRKRLRKITPGPWYRRQMCVLGDTMVESYVGTVAICSGGIYSGDQQEMDDGEFIAHSPQDIDWLLNMNDYLLSMIQKMAEIVHKSHPGDEWEDENYVICVESERLLLMFKEKV